MSARFSDEHDRIKVVMAAALSVLAAIAAEADPDSDTGFAANWALDVARKELGSPLADALMGVLSDMGTKL